MRRDRWERNVRRRTHPLRLERRGLLALSAPETGPAPWALPASTGISLPRTILVPVDGTRFGEHAVPLAADIARRARAALRVILVFSLREAAGAAVRLEANERWVIDQRSRRGDYLAELGDRLTRHYSIPVSCGLVDGRETTETLCEASAAADLLVMATRGRSAWAEFWRGSVSAAVARQARCPVILVRGRNDPPDLSAVRRPRKILVPLDGTPASEAAIESAVGLGSLSGASVKLLHVIPQEPLIGLPAHPVRVADSPPGRSLTAATARSYLREVVTRLGDEEVTGAASLVVDDRPVAEAISSFAKRSGADLIALTTRGRGPLSRLARGSVAEQVVRRTDIPVLLARPGVRPNPSESPGLDRPIE